MASYRVEFERTARRALDRLPEPTRLRVFNRIVALAEEPRPANAEMLSAAERLFRIRVGDYRVIYAIQEDLLLVLVLRIAHRREAYRKLLRVRLR